MIPAVGYLRMSDKKQDKSIPAQREEIEHYAAANGYRILCWYSDEGISGAESLKRIEFQRLILDAQERRNFEVVIVWDQDRFSRFDPMEANYYWFILKQAGVRIVTVATGELDFSGLGGWLTASVAQHGKAQYLRDLSRNVLRGRLNKARAGKFQGNRPPYGYKIVDGRIAVAETAAVVRRIFTDYADTDSSLWDIAHALNRDGVPSSRGKLWLSSAVRAILRRQCYVTGRFEQLRNPKGKFNAIVDGQIVPADRGYNGAGQGMEVICPPLIDPDLWERAQANLKRRTRCSAPNRGQQTTVLNGLVVCGNCGAPMYARGKAEGKHADPADRIYWCSTYHHRGVHACSRNLVHEQAILGYLIPRLQLLLLSPANLKRLEKSIKRQAAEGASQPGPDLAALRRRAAALDEEITAAVKELKRTPADLYDLVLEDLRQLRRKRQAMEASLVIQEARARQPAQDVNSRAKAAVARAKRLGKALASGETRTVRQALAEIVERVELWFEKIPGKRQVRSTLSHGVITLRLTEELNNAASPPR